MVPSDEISTPPLEGSNAAEPIGAGAAYVVSLPVFEGPLDLLLHLIQKHELDIFDIPVSFVTQKYLEYLSLMEELQIDVASEYLVMAATLAHIKSKTLLPPESTMEQEEADLEEESDPRGELIRRLLEYQKYKDAAGQLDGRGALGRDVFLRGSPTLMMEGPAPLAPVGVFSLLDAFGKVLERAQVKIDHEVSFDRLTISERIQQLCERLSGRKTWRFDELFDGQCTRFDLIITFLALLEMTRLKLTRLHQADPLAEIYIELAAADSVAEDSESTAESSPSPEAGSSTMTEGVASGERPPEAGAPPDIEAPAVPEALSELDGVPGSEAGSGGDVFRARPAVGAGEGDRAVLDETEQALGERDSASQTPIDSEEEPR